MYTESVMDHFMNPRNVGSIEDANGKGTAGDPDCGDYLEMFVKIKSDFVDGVKIRADYISDIKYKVHGCAGAISTSSMVSELAMGQHIIDAYNITNNDVIKALGGLPEDKVHCSLLGIVALKRAIINFAEVMEKNSKMIK